jgi:AraC-like DNA-binding protein
LNTEPKNLVVASSAGVYLEQRPAPALAAHFRCVWTHHLPSGFDKRVAVLPDGCSDIIWSEKGLSVVGPDRTAAFPQLQLGSTIIGIRFQPGAAATWLNLSMAEITGHTAALGDFWGTAGAELHERLCETPSVTDRISLLQAELQSLASDMARPCADMQQTFEHLAREQGDSGETIRNLSRSLGIGERTLRRRCHEHFGYGPKTLDRILRFQRLLRLFRSTRCTASSILALEAGYADQAHMSREVRMLAGLSPGDIRRQMAG